MLIAHFAHRPYGVKPAPLPPSPWWTGSRSLLGAAHRRSPVCASPAPCCPPPWSPPRSPRPPPLTPSPRGRPTRTSPATARSPSSATSPTAARAQLGARPVRRALNGITLRHGIPRTRGPESFHPSHTALGRRRSLADGEPEPHVGPSTHVREEFSLSGGGNRGSDPPQAAFSSRTRGQIPPAGNRDGSCGGALLNRIHP